MRYKVIAVVLMSLALSLIKVAGAQPKTPRIGFLNAAAPSAIVSRLVSWRQGLRDHGYEEGKNIFIEWRHAEGKLDRLAQFAHELVRLKVDVIVTDGDAATRAVKAATSTIPIVMAQSSDPVGYGFVASLARPGGSITGISNLAPELSAKRLELLKDIAPKTSRVAVFGMLTSQNQVQELRQMELAAGALNINLQFLGVVGPKEIETAFHAAAKLGADAFLVLQSPKNISHIKQLTEVAVKSRRPAIFARREYVEAGGLLSYNVNLPDLDRRAATYVDNILKGAKPADLPVEQPSKFELLINLKTAKQIGLTIPPHVLARADRIIK